MTLLRTAAALLLLGIATPAMAGSAKGSFTVSMRVLPKVKTLPAASRPAFLSTTGSAATLCGTASSAACAAAATTLASASSTGAVTMTILPDGAPTAIIER